jgi:hypothetical protein
VLIAELTELYNSTEMGTAADEPEVADDELADGEPVTDELADHEPVANEPADHEPMADEEPADHEPVANEPVADEEDIAPSAAVAVPCASGDGKQSQPMTPKRKMLIAVCVTALGTTSCFSELSLHIAPIILLRLGP